MMLLSVLFEWWVPIHKLDQNMGCIIDANNLIFTVGSFFLAVTMTLWSWIVIILYVVKIRDLKGKVVGDTETGNYTKKQRNVIHGMQILLNKILCLIVTAQILGNVSNLASYLLNGNGQIFWSIDFVVMIVVIYLMLEHNALDYYRILMVFRKCGCYCFCCKLIDHRTKDEKNLKVVETIEIEITVEKGTKEKDGSDLTKTEDVQRMRYDGQSEKTETVPQ